MTIPDSEMFESTDERGRLEALKSYNIMDTEPEIAFDRITKIASDIMDVPIALVSLVDENRQWFKSAIGTSLQETPSDISFCSHALKFDAPFVILDTHQDQHFAENILVTETPKIRFYAGAQLRTKSGYVLGTLCILDTKPRKEITNKDLERLTDLADIVMAELDLRKALIQRDEAREILATAMNFANVAAWELDMDSDELSWQGAYESVWGEDPDRSLSKGSGAFARITDEDREMVRNQVYESIENGTSFETQFRINDPNGSIRWLVSKGNHVTSHDRNILIGVNYDITSIKRREDANELLTRELHHRMRNLFSTTRAIISLSRASATSIDDYVKRIEERLGALDRAQHVLLNANFLTGSLKALMQEVTNAHPRISFNGPDIMLHENEVVALAIIFSELATNAVKYGSLSAVKGKVQIDLTKSESNSEGSITRIRWSETGGPAPKGMIGAVGFGTQLISRSVRDNLKGTIDKDWSETGLVCNIIIPHELGKS